MITLKIDGLESAQRAIEKYGKQARYAASRALNTSAFEAMRAGQDHIKSKIDRPTPFTVKSWYVRMKADKNNLRAVVGWSDYLSSKRIQEGQYAGAEFYLSQHWTGGGRKLKSFERQLQKRGFLPSGMYAVPGKAADELRMMDRYGNMKGSVLVAILSGIGSLDELGYTSNATVRARKKWSAAKSASRHVYWAGKPGPNTPPGIWVVDEKNSKRGRLRPVMVFVRAPHYRARLDLDAVVKKVRLANFENNFWRELNAAMRTAR